MAQVCEPLPRTTPHCDWIHLRGTGTLALPGGHLEWGETFETCAAREVQEETGLIMRGVRFLTAIDDIDVKEGKHFVVIVMGGLVDQEPEVRYLVSTREAKGSLLIEKLMEPDKCGGWEWTTWEGIQNHGTPLFTPIQRLLLQRPSFHPRQYFQ